MLKKYLNKQSLIIFNIFILLSQQFFDLDYIIYPFLDKFNLILPSTIFRFIILPLTVILSMYLLSNNKLKTFVFAIIYGLSVVIYFIFHHYNVLEFLNKVYFTSNFIYVPFKEFSYVLTLVIPIYFIYVYYLAKIDLKISLKIITYLSFLISILIVLSNLFLFGDSSYFGKTVANIFSWFTTKYDPYVYNPRFYSSIFFFPEGNTTGILLLSSFPLVVYNYLNNNLKNRYLVIIIVQALAMTMIATRVSTYGTIIVPITIVLAYLFLSVIKREKVNFKFVFNLILVIILFSYITYHSPAQASIKVDQNNNSYVAENEKILSSRKDGLKGAISLKENTVEYRDFYIHYFEDNLFLIGYLPVDYYLYNYHYRNDPKFWVDFIFEYKLEERINARQFQEIFMNYKWQETDFKDKLLGMGWTPFMNSSTDLEKDFKIHYYSFGIIGFILLVSKWIILYIYSLVKTIINMNNWNLFNCVVLLALGLGLLGGYVSGHSIDNFTTSIFFAYLMAMILNRVNNNEKI